MSERKRPDALPAMEDLVDRGIYFIRCRNLLVGAWRAEVGGFIGIREKFGSRYLFTEFHFDRDPRIGTVTSATPTGAVVPDQIPMREGHSDGRYFRMNQPLYDLLEPYDQEAVHRLRLEHEAWRAEQESLRWKPQSFEEFKKEERHAAAKEYYQQARAAGLPFEEFRVEYLRILKEGVDDG